MRKSCLLIGLALAFLALPARALGYHDKPTGWTLAPKVFDTPLASGWAVMDFNPGIPYMRQDSVLSCYSHIRIKPPKGYPLSGTRRLDLRFLHKVGHTWQEIPLKVGSLVPGIMQEPGPLEFDMSWHLNLNQGELFWLHPWSSEHRLQAYCSSPFFTLKKTLGLYGLGF